MSVGPVDANRKLSSRTQWNKEVDIVAPGDGVGSYGGADGSFIAITGASMAVPQASGAAAIVWSYGLSRGWTNLHVRKALEETAMDPAGAPGRRLLWQVRQSVLFLTPLPRPPPNLLLQHQPHDQLAICWMTPFLCCLFF